MVGSVSPSGANRYVDHAGSPEQGPEGGPATLERQPQSLLAAGGRTRAAHMRAAVRSAEDAWLQIRMGVVRRRSEAEQLSRLHPVIRWFRRSPFWPQRLSKSSGDRL